MQSENWRRSAGIGAISVAVMAGAFYLGFRLTRGSVENPPEVAASAPASGPASAPASASAPMGDAPGAGEVSEMLGHLLTSQAALQNAVTAMSKASTTNKGGYVQKSRADLARAQARMVELLQYVNAHPELAKLPPPAEAVTFPPVPADPGNTVPNLRRAMTALSQSLAELQQARGGDLGGYRDSVLGELRTAAGDIVAGIQFNLDGAAAPPAPGG